MNVGTLGLFPCINEDIGWMMAIFFKNIFDYTPKKDYRTLKYSFFITLTLPSPLKNTTTIIS
jgi:hypothetical protein